MGSKEIKFRSTQYVNRWAERLNISGRLISDRKLLGKFQYGGQVSKTDFLRGFRTAHKSTFFPSFDDPAETTAELRRVFPEVERSLAIKADKISDGVFDLLGYEALRFGGRLPDWHFEPLSRKRAPKIHWTKIDELSPEFTGDKKIVWELNRHQYFLTLGQAYWITNNENYAVTFVEHVESWMEENPPKIGVNWLSSLELAFRSISWIWAVHFFKESPYFTSELLQRMLKYLYLHGRHIETYLSTYYSPNTHLTGEALGLYYLGTFFAESEDARRWKKLGYQVLMSTLDIHVRPDGTYCEQSSHYLRYTIDFYCSLLILLRLEDAEIDPKLLTKLNQLFDFLVQISLPNGQTPNFGDDDGGRLYQLDDRSVTDLRPTFALGAVLLDRADLKLIAGSASTEVLWLLGIDGLNKFNGLDAAEPPNRAAAFKGGGFFAARSDWTGRANSVLIFCGPFGFLNGGHAHAHTLGFLLTVDGEPVFVDSGTYNYTSDPQARDSFRSSSAHNCLTVNGESSSVVGGPFSWKSTATGHLLEWLETPNGAHFRGTHNGFERLGVLYERQIIFQNNGVLEIADRLESERRNRFQLHFVLSPQLFAEIMDTESSLVLKDGKRDILTINTSVAGDAAGSSVWSIDDCFVSPIYGARRRSQRLTYEFAGSGVISVRSSIAKLKK